MHWLLNSARGRVVAAVGLMLVAFPIAAQRIDWDSAFLVAWDTGILYWLVFTYRFMLRTSAPATAVSAQRAEPSAVWMLFVVTATAAFGFVGSVVLASRAADRTDLAQTLHLFVGVLAVTEAWLMMHTQFALYYAQCYYDEVAGDTPGAGEAVSLGADGALAPFRKGLSFPDAEIVDYKDFIYYAYTIAMCYQTSDVSVTSPGLRWVTIIHALISFAFVVVLLGFSVNAISSLL